MDVYVSGVGIKNDPRPQKAKAAFFSKVDWYRINPFTGEINLTGIKQCVNFTYILHPLGSGGSGVAFNDPPIWTWTDPNKPLNLTYSGDFDNISPISTNSQSFNGWYHNPTPYQNTDRSYSILLTDGGNKCVPDNNESYKFCEIDPIYHNGDGKQAPWNNILAKIYYAIVSFLAYTIRLLGF
ncbi:MAG: hypothetical protein M3T55_08520 [Pseudomonadota bacterium]|nr:hypothetical protein [Pseudomonadota bacterium]